MWLSKKQSVAKKPAWKDEMSESDRVQERADLANLDKHHNFIKNPRFLPPHIQRSGKSLIVPPRKLERMVAGRRVVVEERHFAKTTRIPESKCCDLELALTGGKPGSSTFSLQCHIEHHPEPVTLRVDAAFKADIQKPRVCLQTCELVFKEMYMGVPVWGTVNLLNQTMLPAKYSWGELIGKRASQCSATIFPSSGIVGPKETEQMSVEFTAHTENELTDTALFCSVTSMEIFAKASGLHVTFSVPCDSPEQEWQDPSKLLLDFGAQLLTSKVKRQLIITNHTAIPAPFSVEAEYF
ncbi:Deleted in lung and esophageal cancer protein 1 [Acipenser ruthenus]|uniref:Deleted in lung and esophageal cancer protein 1 n=1 Tax=Acipenser ruthenus TaxID=7906 RepID=A0A444UMC4_ACIRT|nr:Deleted in lung and esophageal cancer protein 1 [Acipenser ruthenus]